MKPLRMKDIFTIWRCPECGRVSSVPPWCERPICVHSWSGSGSEIWDGNNTDGEGRRIEQGGMPAPGPTTWAQMGRVAVLGLDDWDAAVLRAADALDVFEEKLGPGWHRARAIAALEAALTCSATGESEAPDGR